MSPTTRVNITLDERTLALLEQIETLTGASRSEILRRGVEAYLRELKEVFVTEAIDIELSRGVKKADRKRVGRRKRRTK